MNDTLAAKLVHTGFKSEAKLADVFGFWKLVTEVKCSDQVLNSYIHFNIHNSLYFSVKIENIYLYL